MKLPRFSESHSVDMTTGPVFSGLVSMAIPLALSSILQMLFSSADLVVVGNFAGRNALAAVGSCSVVVNFAITLFIGLSIGGNAVVARYLGAGDGAKASDAAHSSIVLGFISGFVLSIIGYFLARPCLTALHAPPETFELSARYLQTYALGVAPIMVYNFGSSILRSKGDTRRPLSYLAFAGVLNVALNLLFVVAMRLGVTGAALGTALSQFLAAWLVLRALVCEPESDPCRIVPGRLRLAPCVTGEILRLGAPVGLQNAVLYSSNLVLQAAVNGFGPVMMAGSAAAENLEDWVWFTVTAVSSCVLTFIAQNVGAGRFDRLNRVAFVGVASSAGAALALGMLVVLFSRQLLSLFEPDASVIAAGRIRVFYMCFFFWICALMDSTSAIVRGLGHSVAPMVVSLVGAWALRILWIMSLFQIPEYHTPAILFLCFPITWTITFFANLCCYAYYRRRLGGDGSEAGTCASG